jgi:RNA polymerase sigma-70 factor (ECF subfamily)
VARGTIPSTELDEATLIARAKLDRAAFAPLYERYADAIFRFCYRALRDRAEAEDATSAIFQRAMTGLPGFRGETLRPWLFTIAAHVVADRARGRHPELPIEAARHLEDPGPGPDSVAEAAASRRTLHELLGRLTDDQRRVIELRLAGLKGPEIAQVLGKSHDAVRKSEQRALEQLQALLTVGSAKEGGHA